MGARWVVATVVTLLVLAAVAVRAGHDLASAQAVRVLAACACLFAAAVSPRVSTRAESAGFAVAALALFASAAVDAAVVGWVRDAGGDGLGAEAVRTRLLLGRAATALLALAVPAAVGAAWMRIPAVDLMRLPDRPLRPFLVAIGAGVLLQPLLLAADQVLSASLSNALRPAGSHPSGVWPGWPAVLTRDAVARESVPGFGQVALALSLEWPLLEVLLHGVLRQAFGRWGAIPFVLATAALAALFMFSGAISYAAFGGALVTGLLAARSASVFPGIAFWLAFFVTGMVWARVLPA